MTLLRCTLTLLAVSSCVIAYEVPSDATGTTAASTSGDTSTSATSSGSETAATDTDLACAMTEMPCGSVCADVQVDPDHCGACDIVCGPTEACDRAECRDSCRDDRRVCDRYCVDLDVDPLNCGDCNIPCGVDESCLDGVCQTGSET